jgi:hypothetical protein
VSGSGHCDSVELFLAPDGDGAVLVLGDGVAHVHLPPAALVSLAELLIEAAGEDRGARTTIDRHQARRARARARKRR